jgi:hypothetical protein
MAIDDELRLTLNERGKNHAKRENFNASYSVALIIFFNTSSPALSNCSGVKSCLCVAIDQK